MTTARWAMLLYGLAMIGMGLDGFLRAGSKMSLYGGGGLGALVLVGLVMSLKMKTPRWGYILASLLGLLSLVHFGRKYAVGQDPYPALVIVVLSALLLAVLVGGHVGAKKKAAG